MLQKLTNQRAEQERRGNRRFRVVKNTRVKTSGTGDDFNKTRLWIYWEQKWSFFSPQTIKSIFVCNYSQIIKLHILFPWVKEENLRKQKLWDHGMFMDWSETLSEKIVSFIHSVCPHRVCFCWWRSQNKQTLEKVTFMMSWRHLFSDLLLLCVINISSDRMRDASLKSDRCSKLFVFSVSKCFCSTKQVQVVDVHNVKKIKHGIFFNVLVLI